jgi:DNA modification methylase
MTEKQVPLSALDLLKHFTLVLGVDFRAPADLMDAAQAAIEGCRAWPINNEAERSAKLIALVNAKLKLNKGRHQEFLDHAARQRIFFNYHDKIELLESLNLSDRSRLQSWLERCGHPDLAGRFRPVTVADSLAGLHALLRTGTVNRSDARQCALSERQTEILRSLFGSYVFHAFPEQAMHSYFNEHSRSEYKPEFYDHLKQWHSSILHRDAAFVFLQIDSALQNRFANLDQFNDAVCSFVRKTYDRLANHCFFAVLLKPLAYSGETAQWRMFSDIILYAEKHRATALRAGYFRPDTVEKATASHIPGVDPTEAQFTIANEGFLFRDCLVLYPELRPDGSPKTTLQPINLLLLFEKNERDETVIPCPACRSWQVSGNSYPTLGVRSWECRNPICPDRSAFDRGNRYSLASIIKQEAIKSEPDQIPESSLRRWKLDVVFGADDEATTEMLIRHFTLHGDTAVVINGSHPSEERHGRKIIHEPFETIGNLENTYADFQRSAYFKRFLIDRQGPSSPRRSQKVRHNVVGADVYNGDCFEVLAAFDDASLDGAITSPPYYNARSYSVWPNIYCYLYDMYNAARQVFRVLKPGSIYLFNIFDYFDNENNIVSSAMGKKRMILGAYIINVFRRIGFEIVGNTVWYKGEIEGKRNFNQGNFSPYYQYPFNCWEHCLIFRKPGPRDRRYIFPTILDAKPVIKMVRGFNVLGHTAPFPPAIPKLLISQMSKGECVLDPFSGSMSTGRTAHHHGIRSVSIEIHREYCELGIKLLDAEDRQSGDLFRKAS